MATCHNVGRSFTRKERMFLIVCCTIWALILVVLVVSLHSSPVFTGGRGPAFRSGLFFIWAAKVVYNILLRLKR
jgi:hypothetical protein